jgi:hypothetical protein
LPHGKSHHHRSRGDTAWRAQAAETNAVKFA